MAGELAYWDYGKREKALSMPSSQGGFKDKNYIKVMDWVADKASQTLAQTGRITVVVHDNGGLHKSHLSRGQWQRWEEQGSNSKFRM